MTNTTQPGRPRQFDRDLALDAAVETFWRHGFTATSTRQLESALGISQSSITNAFGSKRDLLHAALDRYEHLVRVELVAPLERTGGVPAVIDFLDSLEEWVTAGDRSGCLMVNLMAGEPNDDDFSRRTRVFRDDLRTALTSAIVTEPGVTEHDAASHAELVMATALGLSVAARGGASSAELDHMVDAVKAQAAAWPTV